MIAVMLLVGAWLRHRGLLSTCDSTATEARPFKQLEEEEVCPWCEKGFPGAVLCVDWCCVCVKKKIVLCPAYVHVGP